jgi:hypothetical protein
MSWCRAPLWDLRPDITSCRYVAVWKLRSLFLWGALSDERTGLQFAVQSLNGPSHAEPVILLYCLIWDSLNLDGHVPVFISPRNRVVLLYPWALGSLYVISCDSQGYSGGILNIPVYISLRNRMVQSKVKVMLWLTSSQLVCLGAYSTPIRVVPSERISIRHQEVYIKAKFICYHWEGCMWSMQCNVEFGYQLSISSGTKENHGPSRCKLTSQEI